MQKLKLEPRLQHFEDAEYGIGVKHPDIACVVMQEKQKLSVIRDL